jgi:hypothetical protein
LTAEIDGRRVDLHIAQFRLYRERLARDLAVFLREGKPLDARGYALEWYLFVPAVLPLGIPLITLGGALPGALGFGLAAGCYGIVQKEKWPLGVRLAAALGLAGLGYLALAAVVVGGLFLHANPNLPDQQPAQIQENRPAEVPPGGLEGPGRPAWVRREPGSPVTIPDLLGYWAFDEADGERVTDGSGNGLEGLIHGGRHIPGIRGNALLLNGSSDYFEYGVSPRLNFPAHGAFTFAGWFRSTGRGGCILSQRHNNEGGPVIDLEVKASGALAALVRQDGGEQGVPAHITGDPVNDGQWHHFALTRNSGDRIELFLDGVSQGQAVVANAGGSITTDLRALGSERYWVMHRQSQFGIPYFAGAVDEFCIFQRALTQAEINELAGK